MSNIKWERTSIYIADALFSAVAELLVVCVAAGRAIAAAAESWLSGQRSVCWKRFITSVNAAWRSAGTDAWSYIQRVDRATVCWSNQRKQFQESCHSQSARCFVIVMLLCFTVSWYSVVVRASDLWSLWVKLDSRPCADGLVLAWMGDRLRAGKPSRYVTSYLAQLSLPSLWGK